MVGPKPLPKEEVEKAKRQMKETMLCNHETSEFIFNNIRLCGDCGAFLGYE